MCNNTIHGQSLYLPYVILASTWPMPRPDKQVHPICSVFLHIVDVFKKRTLGWFRKTNRKTNHLYQWRILLNRHDALKRHLRQGHPGIQNSRWQAACRWASSLPEWTTLSSYHTVRCISLSGRDGHVCDVQPSWTILGETQLSLCVCK